jgi:hypothetical protein
MHGESNIKFKQKNWGHSLHTGRTGYCLKGLLTNPKLNGRCKPFKSAGTDEIVPALLQQEVDYLTTHLCRIFRACLARRYIPIAWRQVKVMFIPKHGKAKAYRPISLPSFMLKRRKNLLTGILGTRF